MLLLVIFARFLLSHSGNRPVRHVLHFISNVSETRPAAREVSFSPARAPKERCLVRGQRFPANFSQSLHQDAADRYSSMEETKGKLSYRLIELFSILDGKKFMYLRKSSSKF